MNRAIRVHEHGGPQTMIFEAIQDRDPGPDELLVEVHAAGVNFIDTYQRSGLYEVELPFTPGSEGSGTIVASGSEVDGFAAGDRVAWVGVPGSYTERQVLPAHMALRLLDEFDLDVAAALPLQGMTAHYLAISTFPITEGQTCVVHAAAGGVGRLLVQIAARRGARVVAVVGASSKVDLARSAGAHHVIDLSVIDLVEGVEEAVGREAVDVIYDGVGASTFEAGLELLARRAMMVTFGNASGPVPPIAPLRLIGKSLFLTRPKLGDYIAAPGERDSRWRDLTEWVAAGDLKVNIGLRVPLSEAAEAHRRLESRSTTGKVLLTP